MANKSTFQRNTEIRLAAWHFVHTTRDAKVIGKKMRLSERTIHRYSEDALWNESLNEFGYQGPKHFRVHRAGRKRKVQQ